MSNQKSISRGGGSSRSARPESASEEVADRLAGLLPAEALQDALVGLAPEEITGPGGLVTQLAGRVLETALGAELTERVCPMKCVGSGWPIRPIGSGMATLSNQKLKSRERDQSRS